MNLDKLKWIKNVRHQGNDKKWAYDNTAEMPVPEVKIFRLNWRNNIANAEKPQKGELMLLLQNTKVTHVVEFIDEKVYEKSSKEWGTSRVVRALWMPPHNFDWEKLPHQQEIFGFKHIVMDGAAHDLGAINNMPQFHQYWDEKGGLEAFCNHLNTKLAELS